MMLLTSKIRKYFAGLYENTMTRAYQEANQRIAKSLISGGRCLDCGAASGSQFKVLHKMAGLRAEKYIGIELRPGYVSDAKNKRLHVIQGDLNHSLPFADQTFQCVFGFSVLEHLVNGCRFLQESYRVLIPGGRLVLITPNLSAWFNVFLLAIGKMPSSGPHPDSIELIYRNTPIQFRKTKTPQTEEDVNLDRHLVVFTYRVLRDYLNSLGFKHIRCRAYGYYPFPKSLQPILERLDPWHCHQMVFECQR
jgi:SAM-dependent methyltransferase